MTRKTAAKVAIVAAVVLVLGGLAFTGFVHPGFLLGDDTAPRATPTTTRTKAPTSSRITTTTPEPKPATPEELLQALAAGMDSQDGDALKDLTCADAEAVVAGVIADVDSVTNAELVSSEEVAEDEVLGVLEVTTATQSGELEATVTRDDGDWCWRDMTGPGGERPSEPADEPTDTPTNEDIPIADGAPVDQEALAAMQTFLDSINDGDAAKAKTLLCSDAESTPEEVDELIGHQPNLEIDPTTEGVATDGDSVQLYLRGTANGQEIDGYSTNLWVTSYDGPWCVHEFHVVVF